MGSQGGENGSDDRGPDARSNSSPSVRLFPETCTFLPNVTYAPHPFRQLAEELGLRCPVRFPAYSTRSMAATATQMHTSRIVSVAPMPSLAASRGQLSFQIASSDDRGLVSFWLLSELTQAETETVFDLGIQIGSVIRLVRSRSLSVWGSMDVVPRPPGRKGGPGQPLDLDNLSMDMLLDSLGPGPTVLGLDFYPGDANQFLVRLWRDRDLRGSDAWLGGHRREVEEFPVQIL